MMTLEEAFKIRRYGKLVCLGKVFHKSVDGEFDAEKNHKMYSRKDRNYLNWRLKDEFSDRYGSTDVAFYEVPIVDNDTYLVICHSKKDTNKYKTLIDMGFVPIKGI